MLRQLEVPGNDYENVQHDWDILGVPDTIRVGTGSNWECAGGNWDQARDNWGKWK